MFCGFCLENMLYLSFKINKNAQQLSKKGSGIFCCHKISGIGGKTNKYITFKWKTGMNGSNLQNSPFLLQSTAFDI